MIWRPGGVSVRQGAGENKLRFNCARRNQDRKTHHDNPVTDQTCCFRPLSASRITTREPAPKTCAPARSAGNRECIEAGALFSKIQLTRHKTI